MALYWTLIRRLSFLLILSALISVGIQFGWFFKSANKSPSKQVLSLPRSMDEQFEQKSFSSRSINLSPPVDLADSPPRTHHVQIHAAAQKLQPPPTTLMSGAGAAMKSHVDSDILVVVVLSKQRERRDAIRDTWKSTHYHQPHYNVTVKFSLGTLGLNSSEVEELESEQSEYEDMILLPDLYDSYDNLTRKVLYSFQWVDQHLQYSYLFKCDDDSFALLDRMAHKLANMSVSLTKGLYWGYFMGNAWPKSEGDWAEPDWFSCNIYLPYALGGGYVLSSSIVHEIALNADNLNIYKSEDVTVGAWTAPFNIERRHDVRFNVGEQTRGCLNDYFVVHKQSVKEMYKKHNLLLSSKVLCEKPHIIAEYLYNWRTEPSKCCRPIRIRRRKKRKHKYT